MALSKDDAIDGGYSTGNIKGKYMDKEGGIESDDGAQCRS